MEVKELQNKYGFIIERDYDDDSDNYVRYVIKNQDGTILKRGVYTYRLETEVKNLYDERVKKDGWISIKDRPLEFGEEVIGYNPAWIDEDFNPNGTRIGFLSDYGDKEVEGQPIFDNPKATGYRHFCQAKWCNYHDEYHTIYGEIDDKEPNMPTHYMLIPKHP